MNKFLAWIVALGLLSTYALADEPVLLRADPGMLSQLAAVDQNAVQLAMHYSRSSSALGIRELTGSVTMRALSRDEVQATVAGREPPPRSDVQTVVLLVQAHPGKSGELLLRVSSADPRAGGRTFLDLAYRKEGAGAYRLTGWRAL